jgi:hypothetical protein
MKVLKRGEEKEKGRKKLSTSTLPTNRSFAVKITQSAIVRLADWIGSSPEAAKCEAFPYGESWSTARHPSSTNEKVVVDAALRCEFDLLDMSGKF